MKSLDEIGLAYGTDKASSRHNYLGFYERLFGHMRQRWIQFLEIGTQFGYSTRMWRDYFSNAHIVSIDAIDNHVSVEGVTLVIGNSYTPEMVGQFKPETFDIIIDDGSHEPKDQRFFVEHYTSLLDPSGLLIVEDIAHPETIASLVMALPQGYQFVTVDFMNSLPDSRLFLSWR